MQLTPDVAQRIAAILRAAQPPDAPRASRLVVVEIGAVDPMVEYLKRESVGKRIEEAAAAATEAATAAFGPAGFQVTLNSDQSSEAVADTIVYVDVTAPSGDDALIAMERDFYAALRRTMPRDFTPIAEVVLRFQYSVGV